MKINYIEKVTIDRSAIIIAVGLLHPDIQKQINKGNRKHRIVHYTHNRYVHSFYLIRWGHIYDRVDIMI